MGRSKLMLAGLATILVGFLTLVGCTSDDGNTTPDAGAEAGAEAGTTPADADTTLPDGLVLVDCDKPGEACNTFDPCAIEPSVCGDDLKCHPSGYQNCDDSLACTKDVCLGQGKCDHEAKENTCALPVKKPEGKGSEIQCFANEERHPTEPCKVCDWEEDQYKWTAANGGTCDDGDNCTKDDYCSQGICKGTSYAEQCQDKFSCTDDVCDGKGGCVGNPLRADACLINGQCYTDKEKDADGCNICDPSKSQNTWTALTEHCLIGGKCYQPGDKDPTNCSVCDPKANQEDWTPLPGLCKIDNQCFKKGDTNTTEGGCGECDPALNATGWSIKGDNCYIEKKCRNPGDTDDTGCGECAPSKDKVAWTPVENTCLIEGLCYKPGDQNKDSAGNTCAECDPTASTTTWTVKGAFCLISGECYDPQAADTTGCAECDPTKSKSAFTSLSGKCLIGQKCHADKATDTSKCMVCDFAAAPNAWTATGQTKLVHYDFEGTGGATGWVFDSTMPPVAWQVSNRRPASGANSLYYGNPAAGSYDSPNDENKGSATSPEITLGSGAKAELVFWVFADVEKGTSYDMLEVDVLEGATPTTVWQKNITDTINMQEWTEIRVDLGQWKGKAIKIVFRFDTIDAVSNKTEGVFIDDVTVFHDCVAP